MAHNLFGAGYFGEGDWQGRYFVLSSAAAILLATLFFAFRLRGRFSLPQSARPWIRRFAVIASRPEQVVFFVPVILVTFMLALKMKSGMVTVSWGVEGVLIFLLALAVKERSFRLTGLGVLLLCVGKVLALDFWGLQTRDRWITLISLGAALMFVSFLYTRYRDTIRQYL
jgi:glucose-6-phosphate-specific signal transduction histidine kinase